MGANISSSAYLGLLSPGKSEENLRTLIKKCITERQWEHPSICETETRTRCSQSGSGVQQSFTSLGSGVKQGAPNREVVSNKVRLIIKKCGGRSCIVWEIIVCVGVIIIIIYINLQEHVAKKEDVTPPYDGLSVCAVVRVNRNDPIENLMALLAELDAQSESIQTQIFLIDSQSFFYDDYSMQTRIDPMMKDSFIVRRPNLMTIYDADVESQKMYTDDPNVVTGSYGYFTTDLALKGIVDDNEKYGCDYVMVTNSDNSYHRDLFKTANDDMKGGMEMIGITFTSHHPRPSKTGDLKVNLVMKDADFKRKFVDLGAALVSMKAIERCEPRFMKAAQEKGNFALDWFFFESLLEDPCKASHIYHEEVLFFHQ